VRFSGYWVSSDQGKIEVSAREFDDTDLSDHSDWKEAWQNEDPEFAHGYLDPLTMLHDVSMKITGGINPVDLEAAADNFRNGVPLSVKDLQDLATLIQLLIPKALPRPTERERPPHTLEYMEHDIPFDGN